MTVQAGNVSRAFEHQGHAMNTHTKPDRLPGSASFSSGPCAKRPGWSPDVLKDAVLGRSHRSKPALARLRAAIDETRALLRIPDSHEIAIVPASDTGAMEMAMWSLLGARGVDVFAWESFGKTWARDVQDQLQWKDLRIFEAPYGQLPDLSKADGARDIVFAFNGTTSGVRVPDCNWIDPQRSGLAICDATSAAFAMELDFSRLDVTTFSWQKALGGEAGLGMIILSPAARERALTHRPPWPVPKILNLAPGGHFPGGIFSGSTINTPSLLCVEDYLDALRWARSVGGLEELVARADKNAGRIAKFVAQNEWITHLARDPATRSATSVCLSICDREITQLAQEGQSRFVKAVTQRVAQAGAGHDIGAYRDAPPGFRIWCGATVEDEDVQIVLDWLKWAFFEEKTRLSAAP